jgi:hypothetical protein
MVLELKGVTRGEGALAICPGQGRGRDLARRSVLALSEESVVRAGSWCARRAAVTRPSPQELSFPRRVRPGGYLWNHGPSARILM